MANTYFQFKEFRIDQDRTAMKVTTDGCMLGAWAASVMASQGTRQQKVLDIGTGTGLLALMIAQATNHLIDAVEMEDQAALQALENIDNSKWKERIRLHHADIRELASETRYDFIVSNPPFYEHNLKSGSAAKDLAHHDDGLSLLQLFEAINRNLSDEGQFFLLLPYNRKKETMEIMEQSGLYVWSGEDVRQTATHAPFRIMMNGSKLKPPSMAAFGDRSIKGSGVEYSAWFSELLKPYYLTL